MVLIGIATLGRDADVRYTVDGTPVAGLSLAFNFGRKNANGQRQTQWVNGTVFGSRAESLAPYLTKGTRVYVEVRDPHVRTFEKRDGSPGYEMSGRVAEIAFLGGGRKPEDADETKSVKERASVENGIAGMDNDIPF